MTKTEDHIERAVERRMNGLDDALLSHALTQAAYDKAVKDLDDWAQTEYVKLFAMTERAKAKPAKRYYAHFSMQTNVWYVIDRWTKAHMGYYEHKAKAQARARVLNSRQGG